MRIGIDGRLWFETGVGRYIRNLVRELARIDGNNSYILFLTKKGYDAFVPPNSRWEKKIANTRWHTFKEQVLMPIIFWREHLDILHIPYFNVPIFYPGRFVVTIHDLTILHFRTGRATTLPSFMYAVRRLGYSIILATALKRAVKVFAVSQTTKKDIISNYHIDQNKIVVTYEGVENIPVGPGTKPPIDGTYLLYVGNAYPHKNLENLLAAFNQLIEEVEHKDTKLVFVGKDDHFTKRLKELSKSHKFRESVIFFGEATDLELGALYENAGAFVFPSLSEGFGLPAIEAQAHGCPVVCSDIPVFHEILGDNASYFDPNNPGDIKRALQKILNVAGKPKPRTDKRFDWKEMTRKTLLAYEDSIRV